MSTDRRLQWIQKNRAKPVRTRAVGTVVARLVERIVGSEEVAGAVLRAVAPIVDDEFRAACRIATSNKGELIVSVSDAGLVYSMRVQWQGKIEQAIRRSGARRVVFRFGNDGVRIG